MPGTSALTLSEFISAGGASYEWGIRKALRLHGGGSKTVVLVGTSPDPRLEAVWKRPVEFVAALAEARIDLVLGPAFSIYLRRLPIERIANRSRNLSHYQILAEAGIDAIPAVGFIDEIDASYVGQWIRELRLTSVFLDLQSADSPQSWSLVERSIPALLEAASGLERLVVNGVGHPDRVVQLVHLARPVPLVLTNGNAFHLARGGWDYFERNGRLVKYRCPAKPEHIFANLSSYYSRTVQGSPSRYIPVSIQPRFL